MRNPYCLLFLLILLFVLNPITWNERNTSGYFDSDCNLNSVPNAADRSATWNNRNVGGTLPV